MAAAFNSDAQIDFTKSLHSTNSSFQNVLINDIKEGSNGIFKMTGVAYNSGNYGYDYFLSEFDTTGNCIVTGSYNLGDWPVSAKSFITPDGGSVFNNREMTGVTSHQEFIKLAPNGQVQWSKYLSDSLSIIFNTCAFQVKANDTLLHFFGYYFNVSPSAGYEPLVLTIDMQGNIIDVKSFGDNDLWTELPDEVKPTSDGGFLLISRLRPYFSTTVRQFIITKFNSLMQVEWSIRNAPDQNLIYTGAKSIEMPGGEFLIAVNTYDLNFSKGYNTFVRLDATGQLISTQSYQQQLSCTGINDAGNSLYNVTAKGYGNTENYLLTVDATGNITSAKKMFVNSSRLFMQKSLQTLSDSSMVYYGANAISFVVKDGITSCGDSSYNPVTDTISYQIYNYPPVINANYQLLFTDTAFAGTTLGLSFTDACGITNIKQTDKEENINVYPDPASDYISIKSSSENSNSLYRIYNSEGNLVSYGKLNSEKIKIKVDSFANGLYILELINGDERVAKRFVVER